MSRFRELAVTSMLVCAAPWPHAAADERPAVGPIVAIADIHGAYEPFVELLQAAGLVDAALTWTGGDTRLVIVGDVLDRGPRSREALELVMSLQETAPRAGGALHFVLGNHEVMNLLGELSYVSAAEYAAYADDEPPAQREAAWQRFRSANPDGDGDAARALFEEQYPAGFFGHRAAFASSGRFGRWLLEQPIVLVLDGTAFAHGGLPDIGDTTVEEINRRHAVALREYLANFDALVAAGAVHAEDDFATRPRAAARYLAAAAAMRTTVDDRVRAAAAKLAELTASPLFGAAAIYWYRGTVACSPAVEQERVEQALRALAAERLIVGHTPTVTRRVLARFDQRVIRADTGMLREYYGGVPAAVLVRGADVQVLYLNAPEPVAPDLQAAGIVGFATGVGDRDLERLLAAAPIAAREAGPDGLESLQLAVNGRTLGTLFRAADRAVPGDAGLHEVAAYRIDRLLELGLVPAATLRTVDGRSGTLQVATSGWPDEQDRASAAQGAEWCPLGDQFNLMYVFDALIGSEPRRRTQLRYVPGSWQLALTGNDRSFPTDDALPSYLREAPIDLSASLARRLAALTPELLAAELGDVLDERQREALLARRDKLIAAYGGD